MRSPQSLSPSSTSASFHAQNTAGPSLHTAAPEGTPERKFLLAQSLCSFNVHTRPTSILTPC